LRSSPATPGNTVVLSIDIKLQQLVEEMYGDRRGALVAIDPSNGEVLAFVSKPTFDPNLFVEGIDVNNWQKLNESPDKPLLNRALRGTYPPGRRTPEQSIYDPGYFMFGSHKFRDDKESGHGTVDLRKAIVQSCDTYYYLLARDMGVDLIYEQMGLFGFGQLTGIDIQGESKGILPSTAWKQKTYKRPEQKRWYSGETISLGIGQGYNSFTMLQLAQGLSIIVNNGNRIRPHLVREVVDIETKEKQAVVKELPQRLPFKPEDIALIRQALVEVNLEGTSAGSFVGAEYASGGKTGTAQVFTIKQNEVYDAKKIDERLRDHALYIAYAPAEDPKIALAMVVENAGFGAQNAAPIARRVFDFVLLGMYPSQEDMAAVRVGQATRPIGKRRPASAVPWPPKAINVPAEPVVEEEP
jgi:penicillin-binding protein 2